MSCRILSTWQRIIRIIKNSIYSCSDKHHLANRLNLPIRTKLIQICPLLSSYLKLNSINCHWLISILKLWEVLSSPRLGATAATKQLMPNQRNRTTLALLIQAKISKKIKKVILKYTINWIRVFLLRKNMDKKTYGWLKIREP